MTLEGAKIADGGSINPESGFRNPEAPAAKVEAGEPLDPEDEDAESPEGIAKFPETAAAST